MSKQQQKKYQYIPSWVRVTTFILFSFFLTLGIITIIYIQGNVINIEEGGIVRTGSIRIESNVDNFQVFLNEEPATINDSQINSVTPGSYVVRVDKQDYTSYETIVDVNEGLISTINIQLFPTDIESLPVLTDLSKVMFDSSNFQALFITQATSEKVQELKLKSFRNSVLSIVTSNETIVTSAGNEMFNLINNNFETIQFSPSGDFILIQDIEKLDWYSIPINRRVPAISGLNDYIIDPLIDIEKIQWLDNETVIIESDSVLTQVDIATNEKVLIATNQNPQSYFVDTETSKVVYVQNGDIFVFEDNISELLELDSLDELYNEETVFESIAFANENIIIPSSSEQSYYLHTNFDTFLELGEIEIRSISPSGNTIIAEENDLFIGIQITEQSVSDSIKITTNILPEELQELTLESLSWAQDGSFFIFKANDNPFNLFSSDPQGNLVSKIFTALRNSSVLETVLINPNKKAFYLLEKKEVEGSTSTSLDIVQIEI